MSLHSPATATPSQADEKLPRALVSARSPMLSIHLARGLAQIVERVGLSRTALLSKADVQPERLDVTEGRMHRSEVERLLELALDLTGDPALGLHWHDRLGRGSFGALTQLSIHAPTMREALASLLRFMPLISDERSVELVEAGDEASLRLCPNRPRSPRIWRFGAELANSGFYRFLRSYGPEVAPRRVCFDYPAPPHRAEYARVFGGKERFEQPFVEVAFDRSFLDLTTPGKDEGVHEALMTMAVSRLSRVAQHAPYAVRVRDLLVRKGWPHRTDMSTVARWLGLSVRSLRRRLASEGVAYASILGEAFSIAARQRLAQGEQPLEQIGSEMGFSNPSAFYRAFKRWTGMTPSAYRASLFGRR